METAADALQGANDIIAEIISDDAAIRKTLRGLLMRQGRLKSAAAKEEDSVYRLYYDFEQTLPKLAGHQVLAIDRGEKEGFLTATVLLDRDAALPTLRRAVVKSPAHGPWSSSNQPARMPTTGSSIPPWSGRPAAPSPKAPVRGRSVSSR